MSLFLSGRPPRRAGRRMRLLAAGCAASIACSAMAPATFAQVAPQPQQQPPQKKERQQPITLNFVNAEIEGVSRAIASILDRQILVDPRVKGQITLYSEQPLSPREAYLNYLAALRGLGFTVVEVAGLLKVVPEADAKLQTGTVAVGPVTRQGDQIMTQVFRLTHENAVNLVTVLRPLISPNNTINANPGNNTLVITDYADNLQRLSKIVAAMDVPSSTDVEVIPLQHAVAADVATLVQKLSEAPGAQGTPNATGNAVSVMTDNRTNSLLVRAANPARLAQIRLLVAKLDNPGNSGVGGSNIYVVYLKNSDAVRIAQVLRAAFAKDPSSGGGQSSATPVTATPTNFSTTGGTLGGAANSGASPQSTAPVTAAAQPSTGGFIQADPATNSLIITAAEPLYRQLRSVIEQLDSRRAQVYIESLIVEVDADRAANLGVQWQNISGSNTIIGLGTNFGSGLNNILDATATVAQGAAATATAIASGTVNEGFNIGIAKKFGSRYTLGALATALQTQTGTNILSTPNLITLDNEEAKIVVGQNVPFVTGQYTNTGTGTTSPFQTVDRQDVGTTLRIKPQIGENGAIRMVIYQESSSVADVAAVGTSNAGPTTNKRSIDSTITVDDGQIIVLGGLIEDRYTSNRSKVPLLGDIPYVGALFRSESRTHNKTNLMVFLRPVVMRDQAAASKLSLDRYDYIRAEQQNSEPPHSPILDINGTPVMPAIRPETIGPAEVPRPLGDVAPSQPPVLPSEPASAPR